MNNLELSIQRELDFMVKYGLTPEELFIIRMIMYAQDGHDEYIKSFVEEGNLEKPLRDILESLQEKEIITKRYHIPGKGMPFNPNDVDFNKLVIKSYMQHSGTLGMDLWEHYPPFTIINGRPFDLRNPTKLYKSLEEMCWGYGKEIKFNPIVHAEVIDLLEYGKDNNLISNNICSFIAGHQWELLKQYRDGDMGTFKTTELL